MKKETQKEALIQIIVSAIILLIFIIIITLLLSIYITPAIFNKPAIWFAVLGIFLTFIGNSMELDASTRWGAKGTYLWRWGNIIQTSGLFFTVLAIILG